MWKSLSSLMFRNESRLIRSLTTCSLIWRPEIFCSIQVSWWHCPGKDFVQYVCVFVGCLSGLSVPDFDFSVCFFEYDKKESSCKEFVKFGILPFVVFIDFLIVDVLNDVLSLGIPLPDILTVFSMIPDFRNSSADVIRLLALSEAISPAMSAYACFWTDRHLLRESRISRCSPYLRNG